MHVHRVKPQPVSGQAPDAQTSYSRVHSPTGSPDAPCNMSGGHPSNAQTPATTPHHQGPPHSSSENINNSAGVAMRTGLRWISITAPTPTIRASPALHCEAHPADRQAPSQGVLPPRHAAQPANAETEAPTTARHQAATHSSRRKLSSSPGIFTAGGRRCIATVTTRLARPLEAQRASRSRFAPWAASVPEPPSAHASDSDATQPPPTRQEGSKPL